MSNSMDSFTNKANQNDKRIGEVELNLIKLFRT